MASHNLGNLGAEEGRPVLVEWRWFDSKPTLPLWIGLLLLLVVPRENRKWQAWLILMVPLLAVASRLVVSSESAEIDLLIQWVVTFAIAWACLWLLVPYLSKGSRVRSLCSAMGVMFVVGLVSYLSYFGLWCSAQTTIMTASLWIVGCVSLLLALTLSGVCCRGSFHPRALSLWLMLWLPVVIVVGMVVIFGATIILSGVDPDASFLIRMILQVLFAALFFSGFLYVVNLPVMFLAGLTECYRERLRAMVYRDSFEADSIDQTARADVNLIEV